MKILFLHLSDMHFEEKKRKIIKMITIINKRGCNEYEFSISWWK